MDHEDEEDHLMDSEDSNRLFFSAFGILFFGCLSIVSFGVPMIDKIVQYSSKIIFLCLIEKFIYTPIRELRLNRMRMKNVLRFKWRRFFKELARVSTEY